jgi:hypothetical protein
MATVEPGPLVRKAGHTLKWDVGLCGDSALECDGNAAETDACADETGASMGHGTVGYGLPATYGTVQVPTWTKPDALPARSTASR